MRRVAVVVLLGFVFLAAAACDKKETPRLEVKSEAKNTGPDGAKATTTTESVQIGSTLSATTETKSDTPQGKSKTETEEVIGTVTAYRAGKEIVVLTGDNKKHSFDLDEKDSQLDMDPRVTVGTKVQLVQDKDSAGRRVIRVSVQPNR